MRQGERVRRMDGNDVLDPAVLLRETGGRDATRVHERDVTLTKSRGCLRKKDMSLLFFYFFLPSLTCRRLTITTTAVLLPPVDDEERRTTPKRATAGTRENDDILVCYPCVARGGKGRERLR